MGRAVPHEHASRKERRLMIRKLSLVLLAAILVVAAGVTTSGATENAAAWEEAAKYLETLPQGFNGIRGEALKASPRIQLNPCGRVSRYLAASSHAAPFSVTKAEVVTPAATRPGSRPKGRTTVSESSGVSPFLMHAHAAQHVPPGTPSSARKAPVSCRRGFKVKSVADTFKRILHHSPLPTGRDGRNGDLAVGRGLCRVEFTRLRKRSDGVRGNCCSLHPRRFALN